MKKMDGGGRKQSEEGVRGGDEVGGYGGGRKIQRWFLSPSAGGPF